MAVFKKIHQVWLTAAAWIVAVVLLTALIMQVVRRGTSDSLRPVAQHTIDSLFIIKVPDSCQQVNYKWFTTYYDASRHWPACVVFWLDHQRLEGQAERTDQFAVDDSVDGCPPINALSGSGFHRGHMAPAADMKWDQQAMDESFMMTNVCAQHPLLNEGGWALLEEKCREWARRDGTIVVFAGPVPDDSLQVLETSGVTIPRRFFKVVVSPAMRPMQALAFIYPNGPCRRSLADYVTDVDEVERLTGIDFFSSFPQQTQTQMQSRSRLDLWLH